MSATADCTWRSLEEYTGWRLKAMLDLFVNDQKLLELIDPHQEAACLGDYGGFLEGLIWS